MALIEIDGLPWFTMVYPGLPWFTMVYHGLPWFTHFCLHGGSFHGELFVRHSQMIVRVFSIAIFTFLKWLEHLHDLAMNIHLPSYVSYDPVGYPFICTSARYLSHLKYPG